MNDKLLTILVTGANSQLGNELHVIAPQFPYCQFLFVTKAELDITNFNSIIKYFKGHSVDFCINCAAYTAVDKAETDEDRAYLINADAVAILAKICSQNNTQLIHISTDYVFDGKATQPYKETDTTNPVSVYGKSKLQGEELAIKHCPDAIIIRTSWLYSSFKNNFVKTMLRLMKEKESIHVVNDQFGSPTYAADLALAIMRIIRSKKSKVNTGIYHYTNAGITNWYEFAVAIKKITNSNCIVNPITTAQYPTAAKRPAYSVLDTAKIAATFPVEIPNWEISLEKCLGLLK
ncbi:MAG: dTDP-4-dehydrorhamnose reductase [Chitinophagaceae bacterium]|nr:dTDP-4-dehydrorhamnose reductase [Chitinophagaceae bacterium]